MFKKPNTKEHDDIKDERASATFSVEELTHLLDGGSQATEKRRRLEKIFLDDPQFKIDFDPYSLSFDEEYEKSLERVLKFYEKTKGISSDTNGPLNLHQEMVLLQSTGINPFFSPFQLHSGPFALTLLSQGSEEQQRKWMPLIKNFKVLGAYAQTELGHGNFLRGLETTATYDPKTEEYILNTPSITAIKFWPGALAQTCNFAVVIAQLYIKGTHQGLHTFLVQLRSFEDHSPLPGVTVGSIGPRMEMNATDNGFLQLNNVRIPRDQMLMGHATVHPDGTYVKSKNPYGTYATMVIIRLGIVHISPVYLAKAATIAIRYSVIRHQGEIVPGAPEVKILDYQTQQFRLLPHLATAYAFLFTHKALTAMFEKAVANPLAALPELHALSCGMKALSTQLCTNGAEQCRLACGGFGFLHASRLPHLYSVLTPSCTFEGDNFVLFLQTARFLLKSARASKSKNGELSSSVEFLRKATTVTSNNPLEELLSLFQNASRSFIFKMDHKLQATYNSEKHPDVARNENAVELVQCARFYSQTFVVSTMWSLMSKTKMSPSLHAALLDLFHLLCVYWIHENPSPFLRYGQLSFEKLEEITGRLPQLLSKIRTNAVALVDAFDFRDENLLSVLGNYDGQVYEHIHHYLQQLPSNKVKVPGSYKKYILPIMKARMREIARDISSYINKMKLDDACYKIGNFT